jgi:hypothetical protein
VNDLAPIFLYLELASFQGQKIEGSLRTRDGISDASDLAGITLHGFEVAAELFHQRVKV